MSVKSPSRNITLYHVSPDLNATSIAVLGIAPLSDLTQDSGADHHVWLVSAGNVAWAVEHTFNRHTCTDVLVIEVRVKRGCLTSYKRGIWRHYGSICPRRMVGSVRIHSGHARG